MQKKTFLISIFHFQLLILIFLFVHLVKKSKKILCEKRLSNDLFVLPIFFCDRFDAAQASVNSCIRFMNLLRTLENDFNYQLISSEQFPCQVL